MHPLAVSHSVGAKGNISCDIMHSHSLPQSLMYLLIFTNTNTSVCVCVHYIYMYMYSDTINGRNGHSLLISLSLLLSFPNTNVHVSVNVSSLSLSFDRLHKHNCTHARMHTELQIGQLMPSLVNNKQVLVCVCVCCIYTHELHISLHIYGRNVCMEVKVKYIQ